MSFNCAEIAGGIAKVICDSRELSQLDVAMVKAYNVAKEINNNVDHEQYLWLKQRNKCSAEQPTCLKKSYLSRVKVLQLTIERGVKVPAGWESFYLSGWVKVFNKICSGGSSVDEVKQHDRLVNLIRLNETSELLVLACSLAGYQDSHRVYLLTQYDDAVYAKQITFFRPFYQQGWKMDLVENITGSLKVYKKDQTLRVSRRYIRAGTCGYGVGYNVSDLYRSKPLKTTLKPAWLKGEHDCDKGIVSDNWPDIPLPLPPGVFKFSGKW